MSESCFRRMWNRCLPLGGIAVAVFTGMMLWAGFTAAMDYTNTTEFCISCHEMKDNVYKELQESVHWTNAAGVRAQCADCHVPKQFWPKMQRKFLAYNDVLQTIKGTIDTPEKFEEKRAELAERVWEYMKESDSRECRTCHGFPYMNLEKQPITPRNKHTQAMKEGKTCIDCHRGVAHKLPLPDD